MLNLTNMHMYYAQGADGLHAALSRLPLAEDVTITYSK